MFRGTAVSPQYQYVRTAAVCHVPISACGRAYPSLQICMSLSLRDTTTYKCTSLTILSSSQIVVLLIQVVCCSSVHLFSPTQNSGFLSFAVFILGVLIASEVYVQLRVTKYECSIVAGSSDTADSTGNTTAVTSRTVTGSLARSAARSVSPRGSGTSQSAPIMLNNRHLR